MRFIFLFLSLLATNVVLASDFHSPRTAALGGSGHAGPLLNDSLYLNPSFSSLLASYSISANYGYFFGPATNPDGTSFYHGKNLNASIQDGRSELFQAGVGLSHFEDRDALHLGVSKSFVEKMGFGIGGKFIFPSNQPGVSQTVVHDATLSVSGVALPWLQLAFIVDNLFETQEGQKLGLYREWIFGTKVNVMQIFLMYFDPHITPSLSNTTTSVFGYEAGMEFTIMSDLFLRIGAFRSATVPFESQRGDGYSSGIGWIGPRMSFDFAISRVLDPNPATGYFFGTTFYF